MKDGGGSLHLLEGKPVAEHWNSKHEIWSALFSFDLGQCSAGNGVLAVVLPDSSGQTTTSWEFKIFILSPV